MNDHGEWALIHGYHSHGQRLVSKILSRYPDPPLMLLGLMLMMAILLNLWLAVSLMGVKYAKLEVDDVQPEISFWKY